MTRNLGLFIGVLVLAFSFLLPLPGVAERTATGIADYHTLPLPQRPRDAVRGSAFAKQTANLPAAERQRAAVSEILAGNIPDFLRAFRPVELSHNGRRATIFVSPDYLAVGSSDDFLRVPLNYPAAAAVLSSLDCVLPTPKIVDAVYRQSRRKLRPQPLPPCSAMTSNAYFLNHQRMIEEQLGACPIGIITSGHKKDVVLTIRLRRRPGSIAIYGWHHASGRPIQPLSTVHEAAYADYSHGIRAVHRTVMIDGREVDLLAALGNPDLAPLFTREGVISDAQALMRPAGLMAMR